MTDEEKAEEYADKILSDSKYPFIFSKEKVKEYIIKVYLDSLKCCENAYNKGLADGRKELEKELGWITDTDNYVATKLERCNELEKENAELKKKLCLMRKYIYGNYDLEYKEMQLQHIDEFGTELKVVSK